MTTTAEATFAKAFGIDFISSRSWSAEIRNGFPILHICAIKYVRTHCQGILASKDGSWHPGWDEGARRLGRLSSLPTNFHVHRHRIKVAEQSWTVARDGSNPSSGLSYWVTGLVIKQFLPRATQNCSPWRKSQEISIRWAGKYNLNRCGKLYDILL